MKETKLEVYLITNIVNQKKYVGIAAHGAEDRFAKHLAWATGDQRGRKYKKYSRLASAIKSHGQENFICETIDTGETWEELLELEQFYVKKFNTHYLEGHGYNMTFGGDGTLGYKFTEEQLAWRKERGLSDSHKTNIGLNNARYWEGKNLYPETIQKIKDARASQIFTEETCKKMGESRTGSKNGMARSVVILGVKYETMTAAARALGTNDNKLRRWCLNPDKVDSYYVS